ncbi:hypothetical protein TNCV_211971 [Trichonephila clavipes]|uniref:Uncharacterized protein n=1 Tax=Trichonephila clavipes TaxID=2585209 RepID=A0A8X6T045_TRICX|nr:hypothetical protein TNCV_211971 [Trichonephila clavipes]
MLLESKCSNSGRVRCRIVLLKFPKSFGMYNGHEWVQSPWINEVVSQPVHVHQLDSIGKETRQIRQRVSSHQQSNVGVDGPSRPSGVVVSDDDCGVKGRNPGEDMDVCKCTVPSRHGGTRNSRRAASSRFKLVEGEERGKVPDHF